MHLRNEDNANLTASPYSTFGGRYSKSNGGPPSILKKRGEERLEAKNEEVIRRVVEMQHILQVKTFFYPIPIRLFLSNIDGGGGSLFFSTQ